MILYSFNFTHAKTETMTVLLSALQLSLSAVGLPHLLGQLAIQSSLESIFITRKHKSTNWTRRPRLSDEDAVYLHESVVRGHHICKRI